jgi:hypothetical protein
MKAATTATEEVEVPGMVAAEEEGNNCENEEEDDLRKVDGNIPC